MCLMGLLLKLVISNFLEKIRMWVYVIMVFLVIMAWVWVMVLFIIKLICLFMGWGLMCFIMCLVVFLVVEVLMWVFLGGFNL